MTSESLRYAVPPWLVAALALACAAALAAGVSTGGPGRFLFWVLAAATGGEALRSALLRPTLAVHPDGLELVTGLRRERHPWVAVVRVAPLTPPGDGGRLRRRAAALEIDLGERLVVVPGYRLGAPVDDVVASISDARPGGKGGF